MKSNKKVLGVFNGSFFSNLVGGSHSFFNFCKGPFEKEFVKFIDVCLQKV